MKTKKFAKVIFDRRGTVKKTGMGNVEIYIYLGGGEKKYINFRRCNAIEWRTFQKSEELKEEVAIYEHIIERMVKNCEEMTIENLDLHLGGQPKTRVDNRRKKLLASPMGFIEFMEEEIKKENIKAGTLARRRVTIEAMHRYGNSTVSRTAPTSMSVASMIFCWQKVDVSVFPSTTITRR